MKIVIKKKPSKQDKPFPKLMVHRKGAVMLMISKNKGLQLNDDIYYKAGHFSETWIEEGLTNFNGTITLSNGESDE